MKKFRKFVLGSLSVASVAAGAYYVYKNFIKKDSDDDLDEFDDDFDDLDEFDDDFDDLDEFDDDFDDLDEDEEEAKEEDL
jgi:hypothetical protein